MQHCANLPPDQLDRADRKKSHRMHFLGSCDRRARRSGASPLEAPNCGTVGVPVGWRRAGPWLRAAGALTIAECEPR